MWRRNALLIVLLLAIAGAGVWWLFFRGAAEQDGQMGAMPPVTVSAMPARYETWRETIRLVGSLRAMQGVDVSTELAGLVREIRFESGGSVSAGDLLVQLDTEADQAQLQGYEAQAQLAQVQLERQQALVKTQAVSRAALDLAQAQYRQATANVAYQRAIINKKSIRAPFAGQLGIRQVDRGQYLSPGIAVVTLQALDPVRVEFLLPQQDLARVSVGRPIVLAVDTYPGKSFEGKITAVSSRADSQTRNFPVEGVVPNPERLLRPGMFTGVEIGLPGQRETITVPQTAINFSPYGNSVFVVADAPPAQGGEGAPVASVPRGSAEAASAPPPGLVVSQRFVRTGETRGDQIEILDGLKEGERVVTSGQFKLRDGAPVVIDNKIQPTNNPAPRPGNS